MATALSGHAYMPTQGRGHATRRWRRFFVLLVSLSPNLLVLSPPCVFAAEPDPAVESITTKELTDCVEKLADDVYEGRGTGTRGAHAAAQYILQQIEPLQLTPAGTDGSYFQSWEKGQQNILAIHRGSDEALADEFILLGAHFDHIGLGDKGRRRGPIGVIYNGADDNASGVAAVLEIMEAVATFRIPTRRSILFVFWDAEEVGLLGSQHWVENPTIPLEDLRLAFNVDMLGRLRDRKLEILGSRTGFGLRKFVSGSPPDSLDLDFPWELTKNSDHWTFFERKIPVLMFHTGLHDDYHQPTDDPEHINAEGLRDASRYLYTVVLKAANADDLPRYRPESEHESDSGRHTLEKPLPELSMEDWPKETPRPRIGIAWRDDEAEPGTVFLTRVVEGSPADAAGLVVGDRISAVNGETFSDMEAFAKRILDIAARAVPGFELTVESRGHVHTVAVALPPPEPELAPPSSPLSPVEEEPDLIPVSGDEEQPILRPTDAVPEPDEE